MFAAVVVIFVIIVILAFLDLRKTRKYFPIWFLLCTISFTVLVASGNLLHENPSHRPLVFTDSIPCYSETELVL